MQHALQVCRLGAGLCLAPAPGPRASARLGTIPAEHGPAFPIPIQHRCKGPETLLTVAGAVPGSGIQRSMAPLRGSWVWGACPPPSTPKAPRLSSSPRNIQYPLSPCTVHHKGAGMEKESPKNLCHSRIYCSSVHFDSLGLSSLNKEENHSPGRERE